MRGYVQEREGYPVSYLGLLFHRNNGKPFIRDDANLFSLHFAYFNHLNPSSLDTFELYFNLSPISPPPLGWWDVKGLLQ